MHATHQENVSLHAKVSGSIIFVSLSDVLYVSDWNKTSLISGRKINGLGQFRIVGGDEVINLIRKVDNTTLFSASVQQVFYQVHLLVHNGKIYITATDFCYHAFGHTSTRLWSDTKELYEDGSILLKRPSHY